MLPARWWWVAGLGQKRWRESGRLERGFEKVISMCDCPICCTEVSRPICNLWRMTWWRFLQEGSVGRRAKGLRKGHLRWLQVSKFGWSRLPMCWGLRRHLQAIRAETICMRKVTGQFIDLFRRFQWFGSPLTSWWSYHANGTLWKNFYVKGSVHAIELSGCYKTQSRLAGIQSCKEKNRGDEFLRILGHQPTASLINVVVLKYSRVLPWRTSRLWFLSMSKGEK